MRLFLDTANIDEIRDAPAWASRRRDDQPLADGEGVRRHLPRPRRRDLRGRQGPRLRRVHLARRPRPARRRPDARRLAPARRRQDTDRRERPRGDLDPLEGGHQDQHDADLLGQPGAAGGPRRRTYVSPFVGRLDDAGQDGMEVVRQSVEIFDRYHLPAQVLAASIRTPPHVIQAALAGAHIATLPYAVLQADGQAPTDRHRHRALPRRLRKYASV